MNYEDFKKNLQEELQANFLQHIDFVSGVVNKVNETLEGMTLRFADQNKIAPTIYPEKLYKEYLHGASMPQIVADISESLFLTGDYPELPSLTPENARKYVSFSLVNMERNKGLLTECPYKEVHDMAAIPRWHISDEASFVVNNNVMQMLRMTKEEVLEIAQKNTEEASYTCKKLDDVMREFMLNDGMDEETINEIFPAGQLPFYVISNEKGLDGGCAVLSNDFMQKVAEELGSDEVFILPSSRHEMIAIGYDDAIHSEDLKRVVMDVNRNSMVMQTPDFLSDSVYKYDAGTHTLSVCDSRGMFHDNQKEGIQSTGRRRTRA